jgi:hypothetical protein
VAAGERQRAVQQPGVPPCVPFHEPVARDFLALAEEPLAGAEEPLAKTVPPSLDPVCPPVHAAEPAESTVPLSVDPADDQAGPLVHSEPAESAVVPLSVDPACPPVRSEPAESTVPLSVDQAWPPVRSEPAESAVVPLSVDPAGPLVHSEPAESAVVPLSVDPACPLVRSEPAESTVPPSVDPPRPADFHDQPTAPRDAHSAVSARGTRARAALPIASLQPEDVPPVLDTRWLRDAPRQVPPVSHAPGPQTAHDLPRPPARAAAARRQAVSADRAKRPSPVRWAVH